MINDFKLACDSVIEQRVESVFKNQNNLAAAKVLENDLKGILVKQTAIVEGEGIDSLLEEFSTLVSLYAFEMSKITYRRGFRDGCVFYQQLKNEEV